MIKRAYVAIDPGKNGFCTIFKDGEFSFYEMPTKKVPNGKFTTKGKEKFDTVYDPTGLYELGQRLKAEFEGYEVFTVIEDVTGREGWSAQNNFNFGKTAGNQESFAIAFSDSIEYVRPKKWQSVAWRGQEIYKKPSSTGRTMVTDTKKTSIESCKKLYPGVDLKANSRSRTDHDGKADSLLMCHYLMKTTCKF